MDTFIELKGMRFYAYHGVSRQETQVGNYFIVDLIYSLPIKQALISDDIEDTISYASVFDLVKHEMQQPSKLLEHVAGRIISALNAQYETITCIKLKLSKIKPPLDGEIESASVIVEVNC